MWEEKQVEALVQAFLHKESHEHIWSVTLQYLGINEQIYTKI